VSDSEFQRVEALFQTAADLPAEQRQAFLNKECDGDGDLQSRVQRLLDRLDQETSLTSPLADRNRVGGATHAVAITEGPGTVIDRYKLLQVIGDGGFGTVYMAEQQKPVVRKVALKIIKLGMDTREVVARFEAERQALAMMDHPSIAKVLDGGATKSGRPYFVMELVRGVSITEFCDKNDLATRQRLDLFLRICQAVKHAHQKGVIHRDLKPSNVLVTLHDGAPMPKVIDFGIAKAMHTRLTEKTLFTRFEQFVGTPAYMSPEQAEMSALDVDTRTDIYSLGVLLYELLTGSTPFDATTLRQAGLMEIQRIIREEQPPRPSMRISTTDQTAANQRGVDVAALCRSLRGDLDWIVMKALEKDRSRRYATAGEFAEDVRRHLANEPVIAGPPRAGYRFRKFLARNRAAVFSVCLIGLALVAGIIATTAAMIQSGRNADVANAQADRALTAVDFLLSTLSLTNPGIALNPDVTVLTLLEQASARVEEAFADDPGTEVRVRTTIGRAYANLGKQELAEPHLRRVIEIVDGFGGEEGALAPTLRAAGFDEIEFYHALWTLTNVCFNLERADAFAMAGRALREGLGHIGKTEKNLAEYIRRLMAALEAGAWSQAEDAMAGIPELFEKSARAAAAVLPPGDRRWPIVSDAYMAAGYTLWYTPHEPLAELFWGKALEIQRQELPSNDPVIANTVGLLVGILNKADRLDESEALIRESIEALREVHHEGAFALAKAEGMLGATLTMQGRYEEAEPILLKSYDDVLASLKNETNWMVLESAVRLVNLYDAWQKPEKARRFSDALAHAGAESNYVLQWAFSRRAYIPDYRAFAEAGDRLQQKCGGVSFLATPGVTKTPDLLPAVQEFVARHAELPDDDSSRRVLSARFVIALANALDPVEHNEARRVLAETALGEFRQHGERVPFAYAEAAAVLAQCARNNGADDDAKRFAAEAWNAMGGGRHPADWFEASQQVRIARNLMREDMRAPAEELLVPAYKVLRVQLGDGHPDTQVAIGLLRDLYRNTGKPNEAALYEEKLVPRE